ncbi:MAG TPA: glycoside hydrolase [Anaerolineae bacterium]|nr:glycoside hydrolase [Anaerolineae bacterium]
MSKSSRGGCCVLILLGAGLVAAATLLCFVQAAPAGTGLNRVAAWMPTSWDADGARASWEAHRDQIQELSPVWYQLDKSGDGSINRYAGACDADLVQDAHAGDALVIPLINNYYSDTGFDAAPVSTVIHSPTLRALHIAALVSETLDCGYDGIDIDYESLNGQDDREAFSTFIEELAVAMHAEGKLLSVAVHAKTSEPGGSAGAKAQDWSRIGAAADRLRVMTYAYHWNTGDPGPIAPLFWVEQVMAFATSVVTSQKVYMGVHFYGIDWNLTTGVGSSLTWEGVQEILDRTKATPQWATEDEGGQPVAESWFTYTENGAQHEVWYADATTVAARLPLVRQYGLGGIAIWRLGGEDPANWNSIAVVLHPASHIYPPMVLTE